MTHDQLLLANIVCQLIQRATMLVNFLCHTHEQIYRPTHLAKHSTNYINYISKIGQQNSTSFFGQ